MDWTQKDLEELFLKALEKSTTDSTFRQELLTDSTAALEKLSGKTLPKGFQLKFIEKDPSYAATYVLPDFISDELDIQKLQQIQGGNSNNNASSIVNQSPDSSNRVSTFLIATTCAIALPVTPCSTYDWNPCPANTCGADTCGANACITDAWACASYVCTADACASYVCGANACPQYM